MGLLLVYVRTRYKLQNVGHQNISQRLLNWTLQCDQCLTHVYSLVTETVPKHCKCGKKTTAHAKRPLAEELSISPNLCSIKYLKRYSSHLKRKGYVALATYGRVALILRTNRVIECDVKCWCFNPYTMWALALQMEMGPHKDRGKLCPCVFISHPGQSFLCYIFCCFDFFSQAIPVYLVEYSCSR